MSGWGSLAGKIAEQFQSRIERLKNEKSRLEKERVDIEKRDCTPDLAKRMTAINSRLIEIETILSNKAGD